MHHPWPQGRALPQQFTWKHATVLARGCFLSVAIVVDFCVGAVELLQQSQRKTRVFVQRSIGHNHHCQTIGTRNQTTSKVRILWFFGLAGVGGGGVVLLGGFVLLSNSFFTLFSSKSHLLLVGVWSRGGWHCYGRGHFGCGHGILVREHGWKHDFVRVEQSLVHARATHSPWSGRSLVLVPGVVRLVVFPLDIVVVAGNVSFVGKSSVVWQELLVVVLCCWWSCFVLFLIFFRVVLSTPLTDAYKTNGVQ